MTRYIVTDWDGNAVVRGAWRNAKAEQRRAETVSYCASIKAYRGPWRDGETLVDGRPTGYTMTYNESKWMIEKIQCD